MSALSGVQEKTFTTQAPEETHALGQRLGQALLSGDFVGLIGDLGAGKTQFARGVAQGAGVPASQVASPSFAIVYPYQGRLVLHHADLYRLADEDELYATGYFDLLGADGAMLVEWLDRVPQARPPDALVLTFTYQGERERRIHAVASGPKAARLLSALSG